MTGVAPVGVGHEGLGDGGAVGREEAAVGVVPAVEEAHDAGHQALNLDEGGLEAEGEKGLDDGDGLAGEHVLEAVRVHQLAALNATPNAKRRGEEDRKKTLGGVEL